MRNGPLALLALLVLVAAGCGGAGEPDRPVRADAPGHLAGDEWRTDFSRRGVDLDEITSGGLPKDGIPAIDAPRFVVAADAGWLGDREPVLVVERNGRARGYPLQILLWHEIVNDTYAGLPLAVTYCPLCNSAVVFDRRAAGRELSFGTTGNLRNSDLVMYDRQTETWWQQITGTAIVGELTGQVLERIPATMQPAAEFRRRHPRGRCSPAKRGTIARTARIRTPATTRRGAPPFSTPTQMTTADSIPRPGWSSSRDRQERWQCRSMPCAGGERFA